MRAACSLVFGVCLAVLSGCSGCESGDAANPDREASSARALASTRVPSISGFRQRLAQEAEQRQVVALPVEDVFASLEKAGVALDRTRQQMASPHFARFCMRAHTGKRVQITVCEHDSDERADENVNATRTLERPERRIAKNATTTLLARRDLNDDVEAPVVERIMRTFETLKPEAD